MLNAVHPHDGVLDSGLIVVGVGLGPHAESVGLEAGLAEHGVEPAQPEYVSVAEFDELSFSFMGINPENAGPG